MAEVRVSDTVNPDGSYDIVAKLPLANYASICKTLNCNEGNVAARLLQRIIIETEQREYAEALQYLGMVRGASKLTEFNKHFAPGGDLEALTIQPAPPVVEEGLPVAEEGLPVVLE